MNNSAQNGGAIYFQDIGKTELVGNIFDSNNAV